MGIKIRLAVSYLSSSCHFETIVIEVIVCLFILLLEQSGHLNNLRYADDTTLMAESEEELKSLLMKMN